MDPRAFPCKKTLVFCTAYTGNATRPWEAWNVRYRRWIESVTRSRIKYDQILIVDDGSPTVPDWPATPILFFLGERQPPEPVIVFHFCNNLGRPGVYDYPGWFRSFALAANYARMYGFEKVIHIESDAFLVSMRIQEYCNGIDDDWVSFLGRHHNYPESGIQVMAGRGLELFYQTTARPYSDFAGKPIETLLPFTRVEERFIGDRYGEYLNYVPAEADWTMQTYPPSAMSDEYHWWMRPDASPQKLTYRKAVGGNLRHTGVSYLDFMPTLAVGLSTRTYFEIGTDVGNSVKAFRCDAVCIDPHFNVSQNVLEGRRRAHFFQMTSDEFFEQYDLMSYFPSGVDVAFLDGLHHFEALLRDFINTERYCHDRSVILVHDCLPTNERMAERTYRKVETEAQETRDHWTGDVWRLLPILQKYRPDLRVQVLDCSPSGLVACTRLDRHSHVLSTNYATIVSELSEVSLAEFGLARLWAVFPTIDTRKLAERTADLPSVLFGGSE